MSELISGKDAKLAWANGEVVQWRQSFKKWNDLEPSNVLGLFDCNEMEFRLKPRTIMIGNIEVPAPFEPKDGEKFCYLSDESNDGFHTATWNNERWLDMQFGAWRSEEEIKQVVAALRQVLGGAQ